MATFDLKKVRYYVVALTSDGQQLGLDKAAKNIAWEENESELAVRLNLTLRDVEYSGRRLADMLALCTVVYLHADWGEGQKEIFRGTIWDWQRSQSGDDEIIITCYDLLYYLQKSKDYMYFAKGKSTKSIISSILAAWSVTLGGYDGPNVAHEKIAYKNKTIAGMLTDTLNDAKKLSGVKSFIRAIQGAAYVAAYGINRVVYSFSTKTNLTQTSDKYSMVNLVTRVLIIGKEDKEGRPRVEATLDGKTEYGILQETQTVGSSTLKEAKENAKDILSEKGSPKRTIKLTSSDFPDVRKGDRIHISAGNMNGFFFVCGIAHNATNMTMQMEVVPA